MYSLLFAFSLLMILYGLIRFGIAKWRHEEHPQTRLLWIPGAAFVYAVGVAVCTWI